MVHAQDVSDKPDFGLGKWNDICGEVGREWWEGVEIEGGTMPVRVGNGRRNIERDMYGY